MPAADNAEVSTTPVRQSPRYRTAFETRLDLPEATARVREQLRSWLKSKDFDVSRFDDRETSIGKGATLLYVSTNAASGWQLRERLDGGVTWVSTVSVTRGDRRDISWVSLDIEARSPSGSAPTPVPPRLIRLLLDTLDASDGEAVLASHPVIVTEVEVDRLLEEVVCADQRRLPVVIAAPPADVGFERWRGAVAHVTRDLPGLASLYLLNPAAARAFNDAIGPTHWIGGGAIRTYLPDVDPAVTEDAVRHRVLGRRRIEAEPARARRVLAALPRQLAANSLPTRAARGLDLSLRDFARDRTASVPDNDLATLREEVTLLNELLESADETERRHKARVSELQEALLDTASELEVAQDELEKRDGTIRALRRRLVDSKLYDEAYLPAEETIELPKSFADVLDRIKELAPYVSFTGDPDGGKDFWLRATTRVPSRPRGSTATSRGGASHLLKAITGGSPPGRSRAASLTRCATTGGSARCASSPCPLRSARAGRPSWRSTSGSATGAWRPGCISTTRQPTSAVSPSATSAAIWRTPRLRSGIRPPVSGSVPAVVQVTQATLAWRSHEQSPPVQPAG